MDTQLMYEGRQQKAPKPIELLVCRLCRAGLKILEGEKRSGEILSDALQTLSLPENVTVHRVNCLSNCSNGCTIVLRGEDRWSYVYGNLDPQKHVETIVDAISQYLNADDGVVPWRERPEHFRKNCIARIPPIEVHND